jgi:hypothetical protein
LLLWRGVDYANEKPNSRQFRLYVSLILSSLNLKN